MDAILTAVRGRKRRRVRDVVGSIGEGGENVVGNKKEGKGHGEEGKGQDLVQKGSRGQGGEEESH